MSVKEKHSHYYKNVEHLKDIDAYRVLERFGVTDPAIQHAVKKLLVAGGRGAGKDQFQDVQEAIDSLKRFTEMYHENAVESQQSIAYLVIHDDNIDENSDTELQSAFKKALEDISIPMKPDRITKKQAKKMPTTVKKTLARRKAAKRPARRGR